MKQIFNYLQQLNFSEIEAKLYILLLKSGPMTVADLAVTAKTNRTATYSHINSLLEKGVIAKVKGASNKISANPPEHLQHLVEQKLTSALTLKKTFPTVVNTLNLSFPQIRTMPSSEIKYYKGKTGVKKIYEECLKSQKIRAYYCPTDLEKTFPENIQLFTDALKNNPKLSVFEIVEDSLQSKKNIEKSKKTESRHYWKILPKDIKLTANDILIYDGKVAIINIGDKENVTGVVLENRDYYNNSVQLFDLLWRLLPEPSSK